MPLRDKKTYLWDVLNAINAVDAAMNEVSPESYPNNRLVRSAVEREFEIIGEALNQASQNFPELRDEISDLGRIIAFRNRLAHAYFATDHNVVLGIAELYLPRLKAEVTALLA